MQRQRLRRIRTEPVYDRIKSRQIILAQIENILLNEVLGRALILTPRERRHLMSARHKLLDDGTACLPIRCHNCDFHMKYLRNVISFFVINLITNGVYHT